MCLYVRELKMDEGQKIQQILRRSTNRVKVRRAQVVLASEQGYKAPAIAIGSKPGFTSFDLIC